LAEEREQIQQSAKSIRLDQYMRELVQQHQQDPDYKVEFACYFQDRTDTVDLLEVSPTILDPGDEEFYAVTLAAPSTVSDGLQIRVILVTPAEFDRARKRNHSRGGEVLERLRQQSDYRVVLGEHTRYARELQHATP
jgi:hypothetical protein